MDFSPTDEQRTVLEAPLGSQCVIACPGSGKTATAVRRLAEIRRSLGASRVHAALLSYSNVAVDTFRANYASVVREHGAHTSRVLIATVDSFIAGQVVLPHASKLMGCTRHPFLVGGRESFLAAHTISNGSYPVGVDLLRIKLVAGGALQFVLQNAKGPDTPISTAVAVAAIVKLSKCGAYTYDTGRYWAWRALTEQARLAEIVARRYPHILVDEAQDVGSLHGAILQTLRQWGATVSLIGDPHQAIFEFADADGAFLTAFAGSVPPATLTINRRSVSAIVAVANGLTGFAATSARDAPERLHGAYTFRYDPKQLATVQATFMSRLVSCGYSGSEGVILCRGRALVNRLRGGSVKYGRGATERFANAAILRDGQKDVVRAFECLIDGVCRLLNNPSPSLRSDLVRGSDDATLITARRMLWRFLRDPAVGLPHASLLGSSAWQPLLKARLPRLLGSVCTAGGFQCSPTWKSKVTVAGLADAPLSASLSIEVPSARIAVRTVHEVKGEGIPAVLYLARKPDLESLLNGPVTEEGRVGYVAITRARDLLLLGVPKGCDELIDRLEAVGVKEWSQPPAPSALS